MDCSLCPPRSDLGRIDVPEKFPFQIKDEKKKQNLTTIVCILICWNPADGQLLGASQSDQSGLIKRGPLKRQELKQPAEPEVRGSIKD